MGIFNSARKRAASIITLNNYKKNQIDLPDVSFIEDESICKQRVSQKFREQMVILQYSIPEFNKGVEHFINIKKLSTEKNMKRLYNFDIPKIYKDNVAYMPKYYVGGETQTRVYPEFIDTDKGSYLLTSDPNANREKQKRIVIDLKTVARYSKAIQSNIDFDNVGKIDKIFDYTLLAIHSHERGHLGQSSLDELIDTVHCLHYTQNRQIHYCDLIRIVKSILEHEEDAWNVSKSWVSYYHRDLEMFYKLKSMLMTMKVIDFLNAIIYEGHIKLFNRFDFLIIYDTNLTDAIRPDRDKYEEFKNKYPSIAETLDNIIL